MVSEHALQFHIFPCLDSTNAKAKALASTGAPHGTVVIAGEQTGGRGRMGRSFFSPPETGAYVSMVLRPKEMGLSNDSAILLTTAASVAVSRAVKNLFDLDLQIKWVNDLYFHEKKVGGILAEGIVDPSLGQISAVILGMGLNYVEPEAGFPQELQGIAGALFSCPLDSLSPAPFVPVSSDRASVGHTVSPCISLAKAMAEEFWKMSFTISDREFLSEYRSRSMVLGKSVMTFPKGSFSPSSQGRLGQALDITQDGGLLVRYSDGSTEILTTGEVSLRMV